MNLKFIVVFFIITCALFILIIVWGSALSYCIDGDCLEKYINNFEYEDNCYCSKTYDECVYATPNECGPDNNFQWIIVQMWIGYSEGAYFDIEGYKENLISDVCYHHDMCYLFGNPQEECDTDFRKGLEDLCENYSSKPDECKTDFALRTYRILSDEGEDDAENSIKKADEFYECVNNLIKEGTWEEAKSGCNDRALFYDPYYDN